MNKRTIIDLFAKVSSWKRGSVRAPHKPLLLLMALANCQKGGNRLISFAEIDAPLRRLLIEFGPYRKSYHPEYPFWRLKNDGLWELQRTEMAQPARGHTDPKKKELYKHNVLGGLKEDIYRAIRLDGSLLQQLGKTLLSNNFPESIHDDILGEVGLNLKQKGTPGLNPDLGFRNRILTIYDFKCALCGFDVRLDNVPIGLEAAHIKWRQVNGPSIEQNGLALCTLHHKLFDRGAFSVNTHHTIEVSERCNGTSGFGEWILYFKGRKIRPPQSKKYEPYEEFLVWHFNEVFQGPARDISSLE